MAADPANRRLLAAVAVIALVALAGCSYAGPDPVCYVCEDGIEHDDRYGPGLSVDSSDLEIRVRADGSARWHVRSDLSGENVSVLRSNPERVDRLGERALTARRPSGLHGGDVRNVSATLRGDVLHVRFTVPDFAEWRAGGVLLVDAFNVEGGQPATHPLGTDSITLYGPGDTTVAYEPPGARVLDDGGVVWEERGGVPGETYVAFVRRSGAQTPYAVNLVIAIDVLSWVLPQLTAAIPYAALLGGLAGLLLVLTRSEESTSGRVPDLRPFVAPCAVVLGVEVAVALAGVFDPLGVRHWLKLTWTIYPFVPVLLFAIHGFIVARGNGWRGPLVLAIVGSPFVVAATNAAEPTSGGGADPVAFSLLFGTAITFVVGPVVWYLAYRLGDRTPADPSEPAAPVRR